MYVTSPISKIATHQFDASNSQFICRSTYLRPFFGTNTYLLPFCNFFDEMLTDSPQFFMKWVHTHLKSTNLPWFMAGWRIGRRVGRRILVFRSKVDEEFQFFVQNCTKNQFFASFVQNWTKNFSSSMNSSSTSSMDPSSKSSTFLRQSTTRVIISTPPKMINCIYIPPIFWGKHLSSTILWATPRPPQGIFGAFPYVKG